MGSLLEIFDDLFREPYIVQQYLPDVRAGDKRIILIDGEIAGAINRVPAKGDIRSNMHAGGRPEAIDLTDRDREICATLSPHLKQLGLIFVGIDVIGDMLTEINVTSPTGIREVQKFGGADIAAMLWDAIETRCSSS
jgi:glutathione synthase